MAGLFGGGGSETVTTVLDPSTQKFVDAMRAQAQEQAGAIRHAGPFSAGVTPGMRASLQAIGGAGGGLGQFMDVSGRLAGGLGQAFDPASIQQFMDPFRADVVSGVQGLFGQQRDLAQQAAKQQATQAGAFGGSRAALLEAQAIGDVNRQESQVIPQILSGGFSQALQSALGQHQLGQQTGLAGLQGLLSGSQFDLARQRARFGGEGVLQQLQTQQMRDPLLRAQGIMGTLGAGVGPFGQTQTQTAGGGNPLAGAFGGALAGSQFGPIGGAVGGGLGFLGGLF